jgi:hypothetical protein
MYSYDITLHYYTELSIKAGMHFKMIGVYK